jgi:hypothetical protein
VALASRLRIAERWQSDPVRLRVHVFDPDWFGEDDPRFDTMALQLNHDFRRTTVRFRVAGLEMHPDTPYDVLSSVKEEADMKAAFGDASGDEINVFIVRQIEIPPDQIYGASEDRVKFVSSGARTDGSGIIIDGDYLGAGRHLLTCEVGRFLSE